MSRTDATITDWRRDPWDEPGEIEPEDLEPLPPDRKGGRRLGLAFLAIVVVLFLLAGLAGRWAIQQVSPPGEPGDPVNFTVNEGDTLETVATRLQDEGIITNARVFLWYVQWKGGLELQPGYFALRPMDDLGNIVRALRTSPEQTFTNVTFPEGYAVARMGARLETTVPRLTAANFIAAATTGQIRSELAPEVTNLEGLLFPDSYQVGGSETEAEVVARLAQQMTRVANSVGIQKAPALTGRTPYEILIVASMIEKEAKVDEDRALIARVIYNRMFVNTPLQIDATLYYQQDSETPFSTLQALDSPVQHLPPPRPAAHAHHQPGEEVDRGGPQSGAQPGPGELPGRRGLHLALLRAGRRGRAPRVRHHLRGPSEERRRGAGGRSAGVIDGRTRVAGIIGSPVEHSLSPVMHNAAFAACGLDWVYVAFEVAAGAAAAALSAVRTLGLAGLSVTMPHKTVVAGLVDERSPAVEALAAANTVVVRSDGTLVGETTDGDGFLDALRLDHGIEPAGLSVVVFGAGGAARSVVLALAGAGCREVVVVNRTAETAQAAAALAGGRGRVGGPADVRRADLVVQATPRGHGRAGRPGVRSRPAARWPDRRRPRLPPATDRAAGGGRRARLRHGGRARDARPPGRSPAHPVDRH